MNRTTALSILLSIALCSPIVRAQDQPDFKAIPAAQQAAARYETQKQLATRVYNAALDQDRRQYIAILKSEQAQALRRHNPDLAAQLAAVIQQLQTENADDQNNSGDPSAAHSQMSIDLGNSVTMKFVRIPAGQFLMGSPPDQPHRGIDEDQHKVTLTHPFFMSATLVTQAQYAAVMGANPSRFKGDDLPVENANWVTAVEFCKKLSQKSGKTCRLPTEAEWEYAAHAGSQYAYVFGDNPASLPDYAWCPANSGGHTHPVATKPPNAWGLYDMQGNVWQFTSTWYGPYPPGDLTDPPGPADGAWKLTKGGAWDTPNPSDFRIAMRLYHNNINHYNANIGIRVLAEIP